MSDGLSLDEFMGGAAPAQTGGMSAFYDPVVQAESSGNPNAVSSAGAQGLMQLMPATAKQYGVTNPFDPEQNLRAGRAYLDDLGRQYNDPVLALAAYNAGPKNVDRAIAKAKADGITDPTQVLHYLPMPEQTVPYVRKILGKVDPDRAAQITGYGSGGSGGGVKSNPGMSLDDFMAGASDTSGGMSLDEFMGAPQKPIQATATAPTTQAPQAAATPTLDAGKNLLDAVTGNLTPTNGPINPSASVMAGETAPSVGGFVKNAPVRAAEEVGQDIHDAINYFRTTPKEQIVADAKANATQMTPWHMTPTILAGASHGLGEMVSGVGDLIDTAFPKTAEVLKGGGGVLQSVGGTPSPTFVGRVQQAVGGMAPNLVAAMAAPELDAAKILPTLSKIPGAGAFLERLIGQSPRAGVMTLTQIAQNPNMSMGDIAKAAEANLAMFATPAQINSANPLVRVGSAVGGNIALNEAASRLQGQRPTLESDVAAGLVGGVSAIGHPNVPRSTEPQPTTTAGQEAAGSPQPAASAYDVTGGARAAAIAHTYAPDTTPPAITDRMRTGLQSIGYSAEQVNRMTPAQAMDALQALRNTPTASTPAGSHENAPTAQETPASVKQHLVFRNGQWVPWGLDLPIESSSTPTAEDYLAQVRKEIGWDQVGGRMIRGGDIEENADGFGQARATGDVVGRTQWVGKPGPDGTESAFWRLRPDQSLTEDQAHAVLDKMASGARLGPREQRFADYARNVAQHYADEHAQDSQDHLIDQLTARAQYKQQLADTLNAVNQRLAAHNEPPLRHDQVDEAIRAADQSAVMGVNDANAVATPDHPRGGNGAPQEELATVAAASRTPLAKNESSDQPATAASRPTVTYYHGGNGGIKTFQVPAFFTTSRNGADYYMTERGESGNQAITHAQLDIKRPLDLTNSEGIKTLIYIARKAGAEVHVDGEISNDPNGPGWEFHSPTIAKHSKYDGSNPADLAYIPAVREALLAHGYDGLHLDDTLENGDIPTMVALKPEQIKITGETRPYDEMTDPELQLTPEEIEQDRLESEKFKAEWAAQHASRTPSAEAGGTQARTEPSVNQLPPNASTSIKNAVTEAEAARDGVSRIMSQGTPTDKQLWEQAQQRAAANPSEGRKVTQDILSGTRQPSADDQVTLLHDRVRIHNELAVARGEAADTAGKTPAQQAADIVHLQDLEQQRRDNDLAARQAGTASSRALSARRMVANLDYSLEAQLQRAEVATGGKLTPEIHAKIAEQAKEIADLHAQLAAAEASKEAKTASKGPKKTVDQRAQERLTADIARLEKQIRERLSACPV